MTLLTRFATFSGLLVVATLLPPQVSARTHAGIRTIFSGPASSETCALMADKRAFCWGDTPGATSLLQVGKDIRAMALGYKFRCALTTAGNVECWGHNDSGQLGDGTLIARDAPQPVQYSGVDFDHVTAVTSGFAHACALRDGSAWCWGSNATVQIGNFALAASENALTPLQVLVHDLATNPQLSNLKVISAGKYHSCALLNDNTGACWGADTYGQLGNSRTLTNFNSPQTVLVDSGGLQSLVMGGGAISAGGYATCALVSDVVVNSVGCWGYNNEGELGIGSRTDKSTAFPAMDERGKIVDATDIALGDYTTCAVIADSTVRCWGSNGSLEVGIAAGAATKITSGLVLLASSAGNAFTGAVQIVAGQNHMCVRTILDDVYCWGDNSVGQVGSSVGARTDTPTKVAIDAPLFTDDFDND